MIDIILNRIEIQGTDFKITLMKNSSGFSETEITILVDQADFFDKLKEAYTTIKKIEESNCDNCRVRDLPPQPFNWYCFKFALKQENCLGYEPK